MQGVTLLFNINKVDETLCQDHAILELLLIRCVESVDLTPVRNSLHLYQFPIVENGKSLGDFGVSGGLILLESHIYLHTWPEKNYIRLELSSCKKVSLSPVLRTIETILGKDVKVTCKVVEWEES